MNRRPTSGRMHPNGPGPQPWSHSRNICLHIITFGYTRGTPRVPMPIIMTLDLSTAQAPPRHLCQRFTGISPEISQHYFSVPGHEAHYMNAMRSLEGLLRVLYENPQTTTASGCVAVLVNCRAGMHRSVAVAERMAFDVERNYGGDGVVAVVEHLDTDVERGIRRAQRARAGMHEDYYAGPVGGRYGGY